MIGGEKASKAFHIMCSGIRELSYYDSFSHLSSRTVPYSDPQTIYDLCLLQLVQVNKIK